MEKEFLNKLGKALEGYSARDLALNKAEFTVVPHRTNDSLDREEDWVFKILNYVDGKIVNSHLLLTGKGG